MAPTVPVSFSVIDIFFNVHVMSGFWNKFQASFGTFFRVTGGFLHASKSSLKKVLELEIFSQKEAETLYLICSIKSSQKI